MMPPVSAVPAGPAAAQVLTQPSAHLPAGVRFGLCGAAAGGKTTFLAALGVAVGNADRQSMGRWAITPADDASLNFLVQREQELIGARTFPAGTVAQTQFRWQIDGELAQPDAGRGWRRRSRRQDPVSFILEVEDQPGGQFLLDAGDAIPMSQAGLDRLADAHALVLLFDPMREFGRTDTDKSNWPYYHKLLRTLKMMLLHRGGLVGGRLPHHVAVCVTKFDDPRIFLPAIQARLVDIDSDGLPRVPAHRGEEFFNWICDQVTHQAVDGGVNALRALLRDTFVEDRIRYYSTSSIGFHTGPGGEVDLNDFQNFDIVNSVVRLRGALRPVNVLEPLIQLERKIRTGAW
jgi:hypothetical protein